MHLPLGICLKVFEGVVVAKLLGCHAMSASDIPRNAGQVASWKTSCPFVAIITEIKC